MLLRRAQNNRAAIVPVLVPGDAPPTPPPPFFLGLILPFAGTALRFVRSGSNRRIDATTRAATRPEFARGHSDVESNHVRIECGPISPFKSQALQKPAPGASCRAELPRAPVIAASATGGAPGGADPSLARVRAAGRGPAVESTAERQPSRIAADPLATRLALPSFRRPAGLERRTCHAPTGVSPRQHTLRMRGGDGGVGGRPASLSTTSRSLVRGG